MNAICCADDWEFAQGSMASAQVWSLIRCHYDTANQLAWVGHVGEGGSFSIVGAVVLGVGLDP